MNQDALNTLLAPSNQLHYGPVLDPSPVSRDLDNTGQLNPIIAHTYKSERGQYLSGVGGMDSTNMNEQPSDQAIERNEHEEIYEAEQNDDVLGSGIFDPERRPGTANTDTGVFTSHYSLPGYLAREVPFTTSQDVTDLTDNASIVSVPGGGMAYVEAHGRLVGPASLGPQPPPPQLVPPPPTGRDQSYVGLTPHAPRGWDADSLLNMADQTQPTGFGRLPATVSAPSPPRMPIPQVGAALGAADPLGVPAMRHPRAQSRPDLRSHPSAMANRPPPNHPAFPYAPGSPSMYRPFPPSHPARNSFYRIQEVPTMPQNTAVPWTPGQSTVRMRSDVYPRGARIAMGQAPPTETKTYLAYAAAGVVAGAALKMFYGVMKG